jgi:hypothetical protein
LSKNTAERRRLPLRRASNDSMKNVVIDPTDSSEYSWANDGQKTDSKQAGASFAYDRQKYAAMLLEALEPFEQFATIPRSRPDSLD